MEDEKLIGKETYDPGTPTGPSNWRIKLKSRDDMLKYLRNGERYWYGKDWYGSEKRRTPA